MSKLLNRSLRRSILYAGIVLACSIPVYYFIISLLWRYELAEHNIILTARAGREDSFLIIGAVTLLTVLFFILLIGGLILLNRRISRQLWQPFYKSLEKIRDFDLSRQPVINFETTDITEFAELNQSLQKLITGSVSAYNQQKEFADNASHELQTPLAIVQSKLDLLLQSRSLTDEQYSIIEDVQTALTRVGRINKNLLLLTRIDNSQYMEEEEIAFSVLLQHSVSIVLQFAEAKQLGLQTIINPGIEVKANRELVEILVNNLLTNAIRHSLPGSHLSVVLANNQLRIANTGTEALNSDHLFKRFSTASSKTPGTGLGLALVKQIADRYGWHVSYSFADQQHIFSLHF